MSPNQAIVLRMAGGHADPATFPSDPLATALAARLLSAASTPGSVALEFTPGRTFLQGEGVVQGGAITAMLDFAAACATMSALDPGTQCATVTLTTSFLRPLPAGTCVARAKVDRRGRSTVFASATLHPPGQEDRPFAMAVAVMAVIGPPPSSAHG